MLRVILECQLLTGCRFPLNTSKAAQLLSLLTLDHAWRCIVFFMIIGTMFVRPLPRRRDESTFDRLEKSQGGALQFSSHFEISLLILVLPLSPFRGIGLKFLQIARPYIHDFRTSCFGTPSEVLSLS